MKDIIGNIEKKDSVSAHLARISKLLQGCEVEIDNIQRKKLGLV
jgi:hypothetical protein